MTWMELNIHTTAEALDWVRTLLSRTDYISDIVMIPYDSASSQPATESSATAPWAFTVRFYFPHDFHTSTRLGNIDNLFASLYRTGLISEPDVSLVAAKPDLAGVSNTSIQRIGKRFVVVAPDHPYQPDPDDIILKLEKTLSFGSGSHPATISILQLLEQHVLAGMHILDLGSGSGILSVAMAKLGATILALDNDRVAVQATQNAVNQNGVAHQVTVKQGSLGCGNAMGHWMHLEETVPTPGFAPGSPFDLIAANVMGRLHIALATDYYNALCPGVTSAGDLIISGFTTDYETDIHTALTEAGFEPRDRVQLNEWVALAYQVRQDRESTVRG